MVNAPVMRAAVVSEAGPADSFTIAELPIPAILNDEVLIRQRLAAVNHGDVVRRKRGMFASDLAPPYVLGFEGVGVVEHVGSNVVDIEVGDRVAYLLERGGYAEYVAAPKDRIWRVPPDVSDEQAASITCVGLTAWGLIQESGVVANDHVLVHGAAGGVGSILVQLLERHSVSVSCLVGGAEKVEYLQRFVSGSIYNRESRESIETLERKADWFNFVFDCVGADVVEMNSRLIANNGTWLYYGSTSGHPGFPGSVILTKSLRLQGFVVFDYFSDPSLWSQGTLALVDILNRNSIKISVEEVFPLVDVGEAHRLLEERRVKGKILLTL